MTGNDDTALTGDVEYQGADGIWRPVTPPVEEPRGFTYSQRSAFFYIPPHIPGKTGAFRLY